MAWCNPGAIVPRPRTDALVSRALSAMCLDPCGVVRAIGECGMQPAESALVLRPCDSCDSCVPATPARELVVAHLPLLAIVRLLLFALRQLRATSVRYTTTYRVQFVPYITLRRWPAHHVCRLICR